MIRTNKRILHGLILATVVAVGTLAQPAAAQSEDTKTLTGYVISHRGTSLAISNVPVGGGNGAQAGGGGQPRVMMRTADGQTRELKGEEARKAMEGMQHQGGGGMRAQGGGMRVEVDEVNGQRRYRVTGPDGKTRELTPEEFKKMQKEMGGGGARVMVRSSEDAPEGGDGKEKKPVKFFRFVLGEGADIPEVLERGTHVTVHYRIEGDKKIATKIELVL